MAQAGEDENLVICCALQALLSEHKDHKDFGLWEAEMRFQMGMFLVIRQEIRTLTKTGQKVG